MTRQARYRLQQLAAGLCATGCGRPRWGERTRCQRCTLNLREERQGLYVARLEQRRRTAA